MRRRSPRMLSKASLIAAERKVEVKSVGGKKGSTVAFLNRKQKSRICIVRNVGGIGDILMITPSLRELKKRFPLSEITFAVDRHTTSGDHYYQLVKNAPFLDNIIDARYVNRELYDHVMDISAVCIPYERTDLPARNRIDLFAEHLGITSFANKMPFLELTSEEILSAKKELGTFVTDDCKLVMLSVGSMEGKRSWSQNKDEKWPSLVKAIRSQKPNIKFILNDFMNRVPSLRSKDYIYNVETTSVRELAAYMSLCDHFVGPDSGPMHIAGALGVPSTVMFGSIPPEARINYYPTHISVSTETLPCIGCWYKACPYNVKCMKDLKASRVATLINRSLSGRKDDKTIHLHM